MKTEKHWTLDDVPWNRFDRSQIDPDTVKVVKASCLVERNGDDYAQYLCNIFEDDQNICAAIRQWAREEVQHGEALRKWVELADPSFDFEAAFQAFREGYRLPLEAQNSVRGSGAGEMVARCIVETGTSSWYTAIRERTGEPVLQDLCTRIAADEFRHYRLFYKTLQARLQQEALPVWKRCKIALERIRETEDDELAFAYYTANRIAGEADEAYDRTRYSRAYASRAYAFYRSHHIDRVVAMTFKAAGLDPQGRLQRLTARLAWFWFDRKAQKLQRVAA